MSRYHGLRRMGALRFGRRAPRQGRARDGEAAQEGPSGRAGDDRRARHRHHVLGQGVVRQPGTLPRLREPPAARPHLCAQRLGGRSADRAARSDGAGQRLVALHGHRQHRARWQRRTGSRSARTAPAAIDSLVELLQGRFSKGVMERICRQDSGLFPRPSEIRFSAVARTMPRCASTWPRCCTASAPGSTAQPELLFRLRAVDEKELIANIDQALPMSKTSPAAGKVLDVDDLSAMFGLDMAGADSPAEVAGGAARKVAKRAKQVPAKKAIGKKHLAKKVPVPVVNPGSLGGVPGLRQAIATSNRNTPRKQARPRAT